MMSTRTVFHITVLFTIRCSCASRTTFHSAKFAKRPCQVTSYTVRTQNIIFNTCLSFSEPMSAAPRAFSCFCMLHIDYRMKITPCKSSNPQKLWVFHGSTTIHKVGPNSRSHPRHTGWRDAQSCSTLAMWYSARKVSEVGKRSRTREAADAS